jgi:hypothetical protein
VIKMELTNLGKSNEFNEAYARLNIAVVFSPSSLCSFEDFPRWRNLRHISAATLIDYADGNVFLHMLMVSRLFMFQHVLNLGYLVYSTVYCALAACQLQTYSRTSGFAAVPNSGRNALYEYQPLDSHGVIYPGLRDCMSGMLSSIFFPKKTDTCIRGFGEGFQLPEAVLHFPCRR